MARPTITPEQRKDVRKKIKNAASGLAANLRITFSDTLNNKDITVRAIAKEAGISIGTFYTYYENISDLVQSMWSEPVDELKTKIKNDLMEVQDPVERIRILLKHYVQFSKDNQRVFKSAFLFVRPENATKPKQINLEEDLFYNQLRDAMLKGQQTKIFRDFDVDEMTQTFWAAIHGAIALPINLDRYIFDPSDKLTTRMVESLLKLIIN